MKTRSELIISQKAKDLQAKAHRLIPGGAHTYSKGDDQFSSNTPHSFTHGKGARIWDVDGNEFVDWGMGLTSVLLGHAYEPINEVIIDELSKGCNFIRPSYLEAELAEFFCEQIPSAEMVKFAKNGSNATTSAVKLARAYTGRQLILRCLDNAFLSIDDWFIGDTVIKSGVPDSVGDLTIGFRYNNLPDLERVVSEHKGKIACLIFECASTHLPDEGFLKGVKEICEREGIVLIFDEVVSGFRFHPKGAQFLYGVTPDLSTFGKAMANGFSISALAGKKELMDLGGLYHDKERVFLLSTTYGAETHHLRAAQKTMEILNEDNYAVTDYIWSVGKRIKEAFNAIALKYNIAEYASIQGIDCRPYFVFNDEEGKPDFVMRTLFMQEMANNFVLAQSINPSFSHGEEEIQQTINAFDNSLKLISEALSSNSIEKLINGDIVKPVFRKFN